MKTKMKTKKKRLPDPNEFCCFCDSCDNLVPTLVLNQETGEYVAKCACKECRENMNVTSVSSVRAWYPVGDKE